MLLDEGDLDTKLARHLHEQGRIPVETLRQLLAQTRSLRASGGVTLARTLVERGVLGPPEVERALAAVAIQGPRGATASAETSALSQSLEHSHEAQRPPQWETAPSDISSAGPSPTLGAGFPNARESDAWKPGALVDRFRVIERIGAGGMGVVYVAEDTRTGVRVALKTLSERADPELVARLRREGEAQAHVDAHPNVVRVHAFGTALGRHYLVMDLAVGGDLQARLHRGPLDPVEAARVVRDLARGLAHMHAKGVLHRDLKPANVLFDEAGTPKLVDFGLALLQGATRLTMTGETLGTPAYMAPEQAVARRDRQGSWTDVYGLGGVFYFALTGQSPYAGLSAVEVLAKVVRDPVPPVRTLRPDVPPELERLCLLALSKVPEERPTATDLADALDRFLLARGERGDEPRTAPLRKGLVVGLGLAALVSVVATAALVASRHGRSGGAPAPDAPAAVPSSVSTAGRAPPRPTPPRPTAPVKPTGWRLATGQSYRCVLGFKGELPWGIGTLKIERKLGLELRVVGTDGRRLSCRAKVESLAVNYALLTEREIADATFREMAAPMAFSSTSARDEDRASPFMKAIGQGFDLELDARTGKVSKVREVQAIQFAIWRALAEERFQVRYRVEELLSDEDMTAALDRLLRVLPDDPATSTWKLESRLAGSRYRELPETTVVDVAYKVTTVGDRSETTWASEVRRAAPGAHDTGWSRTVSGKGEFVGGRVRHSEWTEALESPRGPISTAQTLDEVP